MEELINFIENQIASCENSELMENEKQAFELVLEKAKKEQLRITNVRCSVSVDIVDSDIATIEALHDLLLDAHGYSLDFITLKKARELTLKMYKAFE